MTLTELTQYDPVQLEAVTAIFSELSESAPGAPEHEFCKKAYLPLSAFPAHSRARAWIAAGVQYGFFHGGERYLCTHDAWRWHAVAKHEFERIKTTGRILFLLGPGGAGKTEELTTMMMSWSGQAWYICPTNVAAEVVRDVPVDPKNPLKKKLGPSEVSTPHVRFALANEVKSSDIGQRFRGEPKWWPNPPNQGFTAKSRLYIIDEIGAYDARSLALALCCIPSGSVVVFAGDFHQNRPVDGLEMGYWLWREHAHCVRLGDDVERGTVAAMLLAAAGRDYDVEKLSPAKLSLAKSAPAGKTLSLELTKVWRSNCAGIIAVREQLFGENPQFPVAGEGLTVTRVASMDAAAQRAVALISSGYKCITPTRLLATRIGGEFNRSKSKSREATADVAIQHELPLGFLGETTTVMTSRGIARASKDVDADDLADSLYFKPGDECIILVPDPVAGVFVGQKAIYVRWFRPTEKRKQGFHRVRIKTRAGNTKTHDIYYTPAQTRSIMRAPLDQLRDKIPDQMLGLILGDEHEDACAGVLASPHAMTNHRAQGSTFGKVVVVIPPWIKDGAGKWMCAEWLYVAISRAKVDCELVFADDPSLSREENDAAHEEIKTRLSTSRPHAPNVFAAVRPQSEPAAKPSHAAA